jgi:hypothetical protein
MNKLLQNFNILKNLFFLLVISMLTSCDNKKIDKSQVFAENDTMFFNSNYSFTDSSKVDYYESEDFVSNALNNYTIATIDQKYRSILNCSKEPVHNRHDSIIVDTIYTFSNTTNKIQIYKAKENNFIFTFDVTDSLFKLTGNIRPGITKEIFARKFHIIEKLNDKVQIVNSEGSMRLMFYFKNNRLNRINSYLYLD